MILAGPDQTGRAVRRNSQNIWLLLANATFFRFSNKFHSICISDNRRPRPGTTPRSNDLEDCRGEHRLKGLFSEQAFLCFIKNKSKEGTDFAGAISGVSFTRPPNSSCRLSAD